MVATLALHRFLLPCGIRGARGERATISDRDRSPGEPNIRFALYLIADDVAGWREYRGTRSDRAVNVRIAGSMVLERCIVAGGHVCRVHSAQLRVPSLLRQGASVEFPHQGQLRQHPPRRLQVQSHSLRTIPFIVIIIFVCMYLYSIDDHCRTLLDVYTSFDLKLVECVVP